MEVTYTPLWLGIDLASTGNGRTISFEFEECFLFGFIAPLELNEVAIVGNSYKEVLCIEFGASR